MTDSSRWNAPRLAVLVAFFVNGALLAAWVSRIPSVQTTLNLSEGALGIVLLGMGTGVLVALSLTGGLIGRFGSRFVTIAGAIAMVVFLPFLALAPNAITLWIALFLFGAATSTMDVAMNDQAVLVEQRSQKPLMSSFHGSWSIGALAGAMLGAGIAGLSFGPIPHFIFASTLFFILMALVSRYLLPTEGKKEKGESMFRLPPRVVWPLGAIAFCAAIGEGAMADWSGVYLNRTFQTTVAFAALGFAAFSLTMTIGRFAGDWLAAKFNPVPVVRFGGLLAFIGIMAAIITTEPFVVLLGYAAVGLGVANVVPLSFSAAGKLSNLPAGVGIAGVATIGYAGFLAGPPLIGLIAEATSLRFAMLFVALLVGSLFFSAKAINATNSEAQFATSPSD
ncbi:MAG: MFS transporter [Chloroflexi bacterium]|jgi:MFS family permease|nr:MFS transporter [Chloroflexota bacterium]